MDIDRGMPDTYRQLTQLEQMAEQEGLSLGAEWLKNKLRGWIGVWMRCPQCGYSTGYSRLEFKLLPMNRPELDDRVDEDGKPDPWGDRRLHCPKCDTVMVQTDPAVWE